MDEKTIRKKIILGTAIFTAFVPAGFLAVMFIFQLKVEDIVPLKMWWLPSIMCFLFGLISFKLFSLLAFKGAAVIGMVISILSALIALLIMLGAMFGRIC